ncbi:MAG: AAA family ATPase [Desulfuromonas thiophila]|nr:AAA family ATPase [Desulfuromonas thiophila]
MAELIALPVEQLRWRCCPQQFEFEDTTALELLHEPIGQERARTAIEFALGMEADGFNLFLVGSSGTGRSSAIRHLLTQMAATQPSPVDWCYVHDLEGGARPRSFSLPAGVGHRLQEALAAAVRRLAEEIPKIFTGKEYEESKAQITARFQKKHRKVFEQLEKKALRNGFVLQRSVSGLVLVPARQGQPLSQSTYDALSEEDQRSIDQKGATLQRQLNEALTAVRDIDLQSRVALAEMETQRASQVAQEQFAQLRQDFADHPWVTEHLQRCQADLTAHLDLLRPETAVEDVVDVLDGGEERFWDRYQINLLVNNADCAGAPVVFETNPTYFNLFGRIEYGMHQGNAVTSFMRLKAGALHRANGGYLVLDARDLLLNEFAYEALKRSIRNKQIRIEDMAEQSRILAMASLKPEPVALRCKIVLIGDEPLYELLYAQDKDFRRYFKVKADFDDSMKNTWDRVADYARFIATQCHKHDLPPFDRTGVAAFIEQAVRLAQDQNRLTSRFLDLADLVQEAAWYARRQQQSHVAAEQVQLAVAAQRYRGNRLEEVLRGLMESEVLLLETQGHSVGRINGLAVYQYGEYAFGLPARISATVAAGRSSLINIERESQLSAASHDKGVFILSGFFAQRFARRQPVAFRASLCFEQSYGIVDGDSASLAELYALLSALAELPLRQDVAVTGSVNQYGQVQAIGGVNEKIEGFFALCQLRGLTGEQGVLIPAANVQHLMLDPEVVDACRNSRFHVWAIDNVEAGMPLLFALAAMEVERRVAACLEDFSALLRAQAPWLPADD